MTAPTQYAMIAYSRWTDGQRFPLDTVREDTSFLRRPARRESWIVCARDEQEAHRTVEYHFGGSVLWYRLGACA